MVISQKWSKIETVLLTAHHGHEVNAVHD